MFGKTSRIRPPPASGIEPLPRMRPLSAKTHRHGSAGSPGFVALRDGHRRAVRACFREQRRRRARRVAVGIESAAWHRGRLNYASQRNGQISHLTFEMLKHMAGTGLLHVPYRGSAPAITDLLSGQVDVMADTPLGGTEHVRAGKLKLLGVGSRTRVAAFPQTATVGETLPGFVSETWMAVAAPPGTPK